MSHPHDFPPEAEKFDPKQLGFLPKALATVGIVATVASLTGLLVPGWQTQFAFSWLFAFFYFFSICMGCMFWNCLHHATDSDWSVVIRRQVENLSSLLPYFAVFFIPVYLCTGNLFEWWNLNPGDSDLLDAKQPFLSKPFFTIRAVAYFVIMGSIALALKRASIAQDGDGCVKHSFLMRKLGVGGIPAVALGITFSGVDWLMGLDYKWFSTMWGVYLFAGAAGSSMSLIVLVVTALKKKGYLKLVTLEHYHTMGKLMFAFCVFWAYIGFSQYMLIWYANIPEETIYFQIRNTGSWWYFSTLLVVGRFFLPFPVLLLQFTKKKPKYLCMVAGWVLFMQVVDMYLVVMPVLHKGGASPSLFDVLPLIGMGCILAWLFFQNLFRSNIFPTRDPRLGASIKLVN